MIKNIIFDMGNVLFDYNPEIPLSLFCEDEMTKNIIRKELFCGPEWVLRDKGLISIEEEYESIKKRIPKECHKSLYDCIHNWTVCMTPIEDSQGLFYEFKRKKYHIFVLSNAADEFYSYFNKFADPDEFDGIIISSEIQMIKPNPKIFIYALNKWNIIPEESLFIDDNLQNILTAKNLSLNAVLFNNNYSEIRNLLNL